MDTLFMANAAADLRTLMLKPLFQAVLREDLCLGCMQLELA